MMKKLISLCFIALAASAAKADVVKTVTVGEGTSLAAALGDEWAAVDSLSISGSLSVEDFETIRQCLTKGVLHGVDLSGAVLPGDALPDSAFCIYDRRDYSGGHYVENPLRYVSLPKDVRRIGKDAFYYCVNLRQIDLPASVTELGENAYAFCSGVKSPLVIPEGVKTVSAWCFYGCGCPGITLPSTLESVENDGLAYLENVTEIVLPEGLKKLGAGAIEGGGFSEIVLPAGIEELGASCCATNWNLRRAVIQGERRSLPYRMFKNTGLREIVWPSGLASLPLGIFCGTSLTSVDVPEGVQTLGECCFEYVKSLMEVTLPETTGDVHFTSFKDCTSLTAVRCKAVMPPRSSELTRKSELQSWESEWLGSVRQATLYVPTGTAELYRSADYWKEFKEVVETDFTVGIREHLSDQAAQGEAYRLDGTKVQSPSRGVVIRNGRKYVTGEGRR